MIEQKDLERFLEWCGLHHNKPTGGFWWDKDCNLLLDFHKGDKIDLNFLFKWAVPKLYTTVKVEEISFARENGQELATVCYWTGSKEEDSLGCQVKAAHSDTPGEALFLAILQVIDSDTGYTDDSYEE